jgi:hypothetical protein
VGRGLRASGALSAVLARRSRSSSKQQHRTKEPTVEYLILIYNNAETLAALEGPEKAENDRAHREVQEELTESGELVETQILDDREARVVRTGGEVLVTAGPYAEVAEWVGGYYRVDCADLDRAVAIASRFHEARRSPVVVRRIGLSEG